MDIDKLALQQVMAKSVADGEAPGVVVGITNRRDVLFLAAEGQQSAETGAEMRTDTIFNIASMTKAITSVAAMQLVESGQLELQRSAGRYLEGYAPEVLVSFDAEASDLETRAPKTAVTVHHLLSHSSGHGYTFLDARLAAISATGVDAQTLPLIHEPGAAFAYGESSGVLGRIVEQVSGQRLDAYVRENITGPLGMNETTWARDAVAADRLVAPHSRGEAGFTVIEQPAAPDTPPQGGYGLYSTASDYMALLRMFLNDGADLLAADTVATMATNRLGGLNVPRQTSALPFLTDDFNFMTGRQAFGYGFLIETESLLGRRPAGAYGWAGIYNTYFWVDPVNDIGVVVLMQTLPFASESALKVVGAVEQAIYAN